ncbi:MAG: hypothetical protein J6B71_06955 [Clostridia bacterium]|nr:hypothetical protein [Clostridia bacterium]
MRIERQNENLILKDKLGQAICGLLIMIDSLIIILLICFAVPLTGDSLLLYSIVFLFWGALFGMGLYLFITYYGHALVLSSQGILEKSPLRKSRQRFWKWEEIEDWGYTYSLKDPRKHFPNPVGHYRLYFSDHPISVLGPRKIKALNRHCMQLICGQIEVDRNVLTVVMPYCRQYLEVESYRGK